MPNPKKKQDWLVETDKTELKTLQDKVVMIEGTFLLDINKTINSKVNNSSVNDKHIEFTPILGTINNLNSELDLIKTKFKTLEKRIIENLESKKRNVVTNFIINVLTFGKVNKNKDINDELKKIKVAYKDIKKKCENITKDLDVKKNKIWDIVQTRHSGLVIENKQLIQKNKDLEILVTNNQAKIKQLEINTEKNAIQIEELEQANENKIKFISNKNNEFVSNYTFLDKIIKSQKEEIEILKHNNKVQETKTKAEAAKTDLEAKSAAEKKLEDSGIESATEALDFNVESTFNQEQINAQANAVCDKKVINPHVVQIN